MTWVLCGLTLPHFILGAHTSTEWLKTAWVCKHTTASVCTGTLCVKEMRQTGMPGHQSVHTSIMNSCFRPLHLSRLQIILCTETSKKYYNKKKTTPPQNTTIEDLSEKSKDNSLCGVLNQMQRQALPHERPLCLYAFSLLRQLMEDA